MIAIVSETIYNGNIESQRIEIKAGEYNAKWFTEGKTVLLDVPKSFFKRTLVHVNELENLKMGEKNDNNGGTVRD